MTRCKCVVPGHCPWHDCVTDSESFTQCKNGVVPKSNWNPCLYLGESSDVTSDNQPRYVCKQYGFCTLRGNSDGLPSCRRCRLRLRMDEAGFPEKWIDPLRVTDRFGHDTDVLRNFLQGGSAFLVCGGPSSRKLPIEKLGKRGVFSLGINNVAGWAPVSAFVSSDPPMKFHWGIFCDPKIMKFIPTPKLGKKRGKLRSKQADGSFIWLTDLYPEVCPNVWGFARRSWLSPDKTWFTEKDAAWGNQNQGVKRLGQHKAANTTFLGLRLLQYLGAKKIFLVGVDFWMEPKAGLKDNYSFGEHRDEDAITSNNRHFLISNEWLIKLRPIFERFGFETYNCNQHSRLQAFDYVPFDIALKECQGMVPDEPFSLENWYSKEMGG